MGEGASESASILDAFRGLTRAASIQLLTANIRMSLTSAVSRLEASSQREPTAPVPFRRIRSPSKPKDAPSAWHTRRRALIKSKHGGRLKLQGRR